jgi:chromosome segregation ATPase
VNCVTLRPLLRARQQEIERWQQAQKTAESTLRQRQNDLAQAQGQLAQLQERLQERPKSEQAAATAEFTQLTEQITGYERAVASAQAKVDELQTMRQQLQAQRSQLIGQLKELRRADREQEQQLNRQRNELARLETRLEMLDQLRTKEAQVPAGTPLLGQLAGFLTIPSPTAWRWRWPWANGWPRCCCRIEADLWSLLADETSSFTAAVLADLRPFSPPPLPDDTAVIGWASDLVTVEADARPLADRLLAPILLVKERTAAYRLALDLPPGTLAVTPAGFLVEAGGLVQTGSSQGPDSILAREDAWRDAQQELARQKEALAQAEAALADQQATSQTAGAGRPTTAR